MVQIKEIQVGQQYALVGQKSDGEPYPLFAGSAENIADDFIFVGIVITMLRRGEPFGIDLNVNQDPHFLEKVKSIK